MSKSPISFFDAASDNVFLGLEFGMDKAQVTRVLGEPEDWTERSLTKSARLRLMISVCISKMPCERMLTKLSLSSHLRQK